MIVTGKVVSIAMTNQWKTAVCNDDPQHWLGDAPGLTLGLARLRMTALRVTQLQSGNRAKAVALFNHVAQMPFEPTSDSKRANPHKLQFIKGGDAYAKAALFVHMLREIDIPSRMRWVDMNPKYLLRGLTWMSTRFSYPLTEIYVNERWLCTDAYIADADLLTVTRNKLFEKGWQSGYSFHRDGAARWDGRSDAYQRFSPDDQASWPIEDWGCYHSTADFWSHRPVKAKNHIAEIAAWRLLHQPITGNQLEHLRQGTSDWQSLGEMHDPVTIHDPEDICE